MFALSVLGYTGSIPAPGEATLKEESHALQCTAAGPSYNAIPTDLIRAGSVSSVLLPVSERPPAPVRQPMALRKFEQLVNTMVPLFTLTLPNGSKGS